MLLLKKLDAWSLTHFLWPALQVMVLSELGVGIWASCWATLITVAAWEGLDELKKLYKWKTWWLDPAGFCFTDFLLGLIGITGAFLVKLFF